MFFATLKKVLIIFTINIENVNNVLFKDFLEVTMKKKINYQINGRYFMKKNTDVLLAKSNVNQQMKKSHTQQIKDLNNKVEEITPAMEMLNFKN